MASTINEPWREDIRRRINNIIADTEKELQSQLHTYISQQQPLVEAEKRHLDNLYAEIQTTKHKILGIENQMAAAESKYVDLIEELKRLSESQVELECQREVQRQKWVDAIPEIPGWVSSNKESLKMVMSLRERGSCGESLDEEQRREKEEEALRKRLENTTTNELKQMLDKSSASSTSTSTHVVERPPSPKEQAQVYPSSAVKKKSTGKS